jgi:hypothetical protein
MDTANDCSLLNNFPFAQGLFLQPESDLVGCMGQEPLVWTYVTHNPEVLQHFVLNSSGYVKDQTLPEPARAYTCRVRSKWQNRVLILPNLLSLPLPQ